MEGRLDINREFLIAFLHGLSQCGAHPKSNAPWLGCMKCCEIVADFAIKYFNANLIKGESNDSGT